MANTNKQSTQQRGKDGTKERGPKSKLEGQNPKWVTMGAWEQIIFEHPHQNKKHIKKREG
jgi:hypothetical protein